MLEREFPKTDRLRAARSSSVSIASRTSAALVERRLVTQSDGTDQSDGTSLIVALMQSSASCAAALIHAHARERLAFISLHMFGTCLHSL
jgi:hypothetical protein